VATFYPSVFPLETDYSYSGVPRETREEWPLPTVETEAHGDSRSTCTNGSGHCLDWFAGLVVPIQEIMPCLGCSSRHSTMYFLLTEHNLSPLTNTLGRQSCRVACLSISISGCTCAASSFSAVDNLWSLASSVLSSTTWRPISTSSSSSSSSSLSSLFMSSSLSLSP
jgi:hypothetical protein